MMTIRCRPDCQVACVGPVTYGRTLLHDVIGAENVVRVTFVDAERRRNDERATQREKEALVDGLTIGGRLFKMFAFRDDNPGSYVFVPTPGASSDGTLRWNSVSEARALLADFESVPSLPKYASRPILALSQAPRYGRDCTEMRPRLHRDCTEMRPR